jgi:hypothetical protein
VASGASSICICMLVVYICSGCCGSTGCMRALWPRVLVVYMFPQLLVYVHISMQTHTILPARH